MTDQGTEFFNKHFLALLKNGGIELFNTFNETKASVVERVRSFKTQMWRYFTARKTLRYVDMLSDLVYSYNHNRHSSIKTKPALVTIENENKIWHTLYDVSTNNVKRKKPKLKTGDQVRISKIKRKFEKGYLPNFLKEIFTVSQTIARNPPVYKLKDYDGEELKGTFYDKELQRVIKHGDIYEIEKILKKTWERERCAIFCKMVRLPQQV